MNRRLKVIAILTAVLLSMLPAAVNAAVPVSQQSRIEQRAIPSPVPPTEATAVATVTPPKKATDASGTPTYAQREASAKGLEHFQGGGVGVYIGGSTLVVVLLVVLILVLI